MFLLYDIIFDYRVSFTELMSQSFLKILLPNNQQENLIDFYYAY